MNEGGKFTHREIRGQRGAQRVGKLNSESNSFLSTKERNLAVEKL
jgi:hypothetical protein